MSQTHVQPTTLMVSRMHTQLFVEKQKQKQKQKIGQLGQHC